MSSNSKIEPGKYTAKILDYWVDKTQANVPRVNVKLKVLVEQSQNVLLWTGSLATEKSINNVLKTLEVCGLPSRDSLGAVAKGITSGALDLTREVEVDVIHENKTSKDGKPYIWVSIAWINHLGSAKKDAMAADEFEAFLAKSPLPKQTPPPPSDLNVPPWQNNDVPPWHDPLANMNSFKKELYDNVRRNRQNK